MHRQLLGLLGLRIFEACGANVDNLGEELGHRVLEVRGKGDKTVLVPLPPAVARVIDRAVDERGYGPILRNADGVRMDRLAATRRLKQPADGAGIRIVRMHPQPDRSMRGSRIESGSAGHLDHAWPGNGRATSEQVAEMSGFLEFRGRRMPSPGTVLGRQLIARRRGMSETFRMAAAQIGLLRYWLAQGELNGGRFGVADGNFELRFTDARIVDVDFSGLSFSSFLAHDSVFERCDFSRTAFDHVILGATGSDDERWDELSWPETVYRECTFSRTRFPRRPNLGNARFERCVFDGARLRDLTYTTEAQFVECIFRGKIQDVNFWGTPTEHTAALGRDRNTFTGNDFTGADVLGVAFNHIDLHAQRFPGLPDYAVLDRVDRRVTAVLVAMAAWPDDEIKTQAVRSLRFRAADAIKYNAGHALVSRSWVGRRLPPDVRDQIFGMLVDYSDDQQ